MIFMLCHWTNILVNELNVLHLRDSVPLELLLKH